MTHSIITAILCDPPPGDWLNYTGLISLGIVVDAGDPVWTGWQLESTAIPSGDGSGGEGEALQVLVGRSLETEELPDLLRLLEDEDSAPQLTHIPGLLPAVEVALTKAMARAQKVSLADVLRPMAPGAVSTRSAPTRLILEVDNRMATAAIVQMMLALQPDGFGYRLAHGSAAEAIGRQGEYLQRFVRELGTLLLGRDYPAGGPPIIYLGLNGMLGDLTADAWRELGHVLGHVSGLEKAAGSVPLWLEDPLIIEDDVLHAGALNQLRDFMRVRQMRARVIGGAHSVSEGDLQMLCDTGAVDGVRLQRGDWPSLRAFLAAIARVQTADKDVIIGAGRLASCDQISHALAIGEVWGTAAVLVGLDEAGQTAAEATAMVRRRRLWHDYQGR